MKWPTQAQEISIAIKELFPVVIAAAIYVTGFAKTSHLRTKILIQFFAPAYSYTQ